MLRVSVESLAVLVVWVSLAACGQGDHASSSPSDAGSQPDAAVVQQETPDAGSGLHAGDTLTTANYPNGLVVTQDAILVVAGAQHNSPNSMPLPSGMQSVVQVFDRVTGQHIKDISVAAGGHSAVLSPDGLHMYVAHYSLDNAVTVINVGAQAVEAVVGGASQYNVLVPDALSVSADGQYVYVASNGPNNSGWINRVLTSSNTLDTWRATITGGYVCGVTVSADGHTLYVNSWTGGSVHRVDVDTQSQTTQLSVGQFPHASIADVTGKFIYVMVSGGNKVSKVNASDLSLVHDIPGPFAGQWGGPVWGMRSPSGKYMFVSNFEVGGISVMDVDAQSPTVDTVVGMRSAGLHPVFMALSPDGKTLYAANNGDSTISVLDVSSWM